MFDGCGASKRINCYIIGTFISDKRLCFWQEEILRTFFAVITFIVLLSGALVTAQPTPSVQLDLPAAPIAVSSESGFVSYEGPSAPASVIDLQDASQQATGQASSQPATAGQSSSQQDAAQKSAPIQAPANKGAPASELQPKRILGVMPNYRAVSAGAIPPPPTAKEAFKIATLNSFDYSALVFVGVTSFLAEATEAHPALGKGLPGFGRYYWRGFIDKTDGNYLVIFALPTFLHEDERYYAMGSGHNFWWRGVYAATRIVITPNYQGHNTFNAADVFGRGISQAISTTYYPASDRTAGEIAVKYGWAMGRDALTNVFREYWPDIAIHILHRKP